MQPTNEKRLAILEGVVIGSSLGLLAGILFAPKSGEELRFGMKEKAENTIGEIKNIYSDAEMKAKAILEDAKHRAEDLRRETTHQFAGFWSHAKNAVCRKA
jgi:gas vesicle protein